MPELPEVQTVVNTLNPHLMGRRVLRLVHVRDDMVTPDLKTEMRGLSWSGPDNCSRRLSEVA